VCVFFFSLRPVCLTSSLSSQAVSDQSKGQVLRCPGRQAAGCLQDVVRPGARRSCRLFAGLTIALSLSQRDETRPLISGFIGAQHKSFSLHDDALAWAFPDGSSAPASDKTIATSGDAILSPALPVTIRVEGLEDATEGPDGLWRTRSGRLIVYTE
jgi:hypothetical protein